MLVLLGLLVFLRLHCVVKAQWPSVEVAQTRFAGVCGEAGQFDCGVIGENRCISLKQFHDGHPNCPDESDEFCFPGQIRCGSYCANLEHLADCITTPRCTDELGIKSSPDTQEASFCSLLKRKLCLLPNTIPCKGYGECVLNKWLMDGKADCFDNSDEDPQYVKLFKFSEQAGHHIQPHIVSTGGSAPVFPFAIPLPSNPEPTPHENQHPLSPIPITVPPLITQDQFPLRLPEQEHTVTLYPHQPITLSTFDPTQHPFQSIPNHPIATLYPHQSITHKEHQTLYPTLYPNQQTTQFPPHHTIDTVHQTLYPNQPIKEHQTLYPNQQTTLYPNQVIQHTKAILTTQPPITQTKSNPTWWPFGKEIFETTKEYTDKLDEFGEVYGPATQPYIPISANIPTHPESHTQSSFGINEQPSKPTSIEWEVYPPEDAGTSIEPIAITGITVDLPVSPGGEVAKPWWLQPKGQETTTNKHHSTSHSNQTPKVHKPEEDIKPLVVPGDGIFVWPNGTVNGPWLTKTTPQTQKTESSEHHTQITSHHENYQTLGTPTRTHNLVTTTPLHTTDVEYNTSPQPSSGIWIIDPAHQLPNQIPDLSHLPQSVTPVLVPPTYMPIVSTYPPAETFAPGPSTILPIYPDEIGQNVKYPASSTKRHGTTKEVEPVTIPAIQSTIGEYEGGVEETEGTDEWVTGERRTTLEAILPHKTSIPPTTIQKTTSSLYVSTQYEVETTQTELEVTTHIDLLTSTGKGVLSTVEEAEETTTIQGNLSHPETSTQQPLSSTSISEDEGTQLDWAPLLGVGGLASTLSQPSIRKLNCTQKLRSVAEKLVKNPRCECGVGEMKLQSGDCRRAPLATFSGKVDKFCGKRLKNDKLAEELVVLKVAQSGLENVCVREHKEGETSFVLNALCPLNASNCSIEDLQHQISFPIGKKQRDQLPEVELQIEEVKNGACSSSELNDCASGSVCKKFGLRYRCFCSLTDLDSKDNGSSCSGDVHCIRVFGICLLVWLLILLLLLCFLPLLLCCLCYRCGYLQKSALWPKLQELGFFRRTKREDVEAGSTVNAPRPPSPTQKHNEGLPRAADATIGRLPEIPSHIPIKDQDDSVPDYYNVGNESEYETDSASHGLVSLISTDQSGIEASEDGDQSKFVPVEVHRDPSAVELVEDAKKAEAEEKKSTSSRAGTPTIWEKFQILGTQYAQVTEKPPSETASLDSLLRKYQEKELAKLKEKEPELFQIPETSIDQVNNQLLPIGSTQVANTPYQSGQTGALPYFTQIPPTPLESQETFFNSHQTGHQSFQQQLPAASEEESASATPLPIEDAIALAEQLNQEYKQRKEERRLKGEAESSLSSNGDSSSVASTLSPSPNSDELFHYPHIDNTFDYDEQNPSLSETDTKRTSTAPKNLKRATTAGGPVRVTSILRKTITAQSADGISNKQQKEEELELAEALASGKYPLPAHMRLKMPIDSPDKVDQKRQNVVTKKSTPESRRQIQQQRQLDSQSRAKQQVQQKRQPKPPIPSAAKRQPLNNGTNSRKETAQKPPIPPMKLPPPAIGASNSKGQGPRPEAPTFGQSRASTMSSGQKRQSIQSDQHQRVASSLPNSERHLKRESQPIGDLQPPKRSPSLPSIGPNAIKPKLDLKKADFMIADIDLDLPGPHMVYFSFLLPIFFFKIPATLDDIKSGRLAEVIAGTSSQLKEVVEREFQSTIHSRGQITTKQSTLKLDKPTMDPDLEDAGSSRLPPINQSDERMQGRASRPNLDALKTGLGVDSSQKSISDSSQKSILDTWRRSELEERVHENCLTDRKPWDGTPLKEGELEKIPLDYNIPRRSRSLNNFLNRRRSQSFGDLSNEINNQRSPILEIDVNKGAASERLKTRQIRRNNPLLLAEDSKVGIEKREIKWSKHIGEMPENLEQRRQWVEELKSSLSSKNWLEYD